MQRRPGIPVDSTRIFDTYIRGQSSQQFHLALAGLALAAVDSAHHLAGLALDLPVSALDLAVSALDLAEFVLDLVGFDIPVVGFDIPLVGFDVPLVGFDVPLVGFDVPLVGFDVPLAGFVLLLADLAPAHARRVLALLLPVRYLARIATVSQLPQLYQLARLLDLSLCRVVQSNRILRDRCVRQVPHAIDGSLLTPSWASIFG